MVDVCFGEVASKPKVHSYRHAYRMLNRGCWELLFSTSPGGLLSFGLFLPYPHLVENRLLHLWNLAAGFCWCPSLLCLFRRFAWFFNILSFVFLMAFRSDFWTRLLLSITFVVLTASPSMPVIFFWSLPLQFFSAQTPNWLFIDITFFIKGVVRSPRSLANFSYFNFYGEFVEILYLRPNQIQLVCFKVFESNVESCVPLFFPVCFCYWSCSSFFHSPRCAIAAQPPCRARI